MIDKHFMLYPIYFNSNLTKSQGRKYSKELCKPISVYELSQYVMQFRRENNLKVSDLEPSVEKKNHPKSLNSHCSKNDLGRLKIAFNSNQTDKSKILEYILERLTGKKEVKKSKFVRKKKDKKSKSVVY